MRSHWSRRKPPCLQSSEHRRFLSPETSAFCNSYWATCWAASLFPLLFLPQYFRGELFTAYELMQRRFGPNIRKFTAGLFLLLRALAEGVRVFAVSIVISIVLGTGEVASIALIVGLTLIYTFEGGMTAVIWTDVVQMILYVGGAVASLFLILHLIPGGWAHVSGVAGS